MTPEKTGAYIYLEQYGEYVVGDLYMRGGAILKATLTKEKMFVPERDVNGLCSRVDGRWPFANSGMEVIFLGDFMYYGSEGVDKQKFLDAFSEGTPLGRLLEN